MHKKSRNSKILSSVKFSSPPIKNAYVPQLKLPSDPFPILLCNIEKIDPALLTWQDPEHPDHKIHNIIYDIPGLADKPVFSTVHHWPTTDSSDT